MASAYFLRDNQPSFNQPEDNSTKSLKIIGLQNGKYAL